jgi:hypothetical protein
MNAPLGFRPTIPAASSGLSAARTSGFIMMPRTPRTAIQANHTIVTGPNTAPIPAVPRRCTMNSAMMIPRLIHITQGFSDGVATESPSIAPSTEMAGVMIPSP